MSGKGMMPSFAYQMTKEQMDAVVVLSAYGNA